ncbi:3'-5' exonuclease family protein [Azospira restricta]|uniref:DNA-directed DNA polymerase n=1 Tax=Azospira restricta TaxID=404405 RepID=A0A974SM61_9RHOO|nr:3'-5' exonuclease family protein [Azospira restricta]QRJ62786.1 ethanolamine utilization protein [Azospira restricta]
MNLPISRPLVFVDLETTGANFARDRVLEVGLVEVDEHGVREWAALVNPGVPVTPFITGLTGIDDTMVADAPGFERLADELRRRLAGKLFVAHNARFDYGFLKAEFARLGVDFRATVLCTVKLSRKLFPQHNRHNLDTLIERHGVAADARHRALADARVLWDLWQRWHADPGADALAAAVAALTQAATLPPDLDPALADELPDIHGAYALLGADGETLLTGRASNLRQKVLSHFAGARFSLPPASLVRRIEWFDAAGEFGARLHEIRLQRRRKPIPAELCAWRLREVAPGDFRPFLATPDDARFGGDDELFGLYGTQREARQALRKLAEAHFLCPARLGLEAEKPGKPCSAVKGHHCRGVCVGKEDASRHSARLMAALGKLKLKAWPFAGPVALVERDAFGMIEDFHVVDRWRYRGLARNDETLRELAESAEELPFDPDVYRVLLKYIQGNSLRVVTLPAGSSPAPAR